MGTEHGQTTMPGSSRFENRRGNTKDDRERIPHELLPAQRTRCIGKFGLKWKIQHSFTAPVSGLYDRCGALSSTAIIDADKELTSGRDLLGRPERPGGGCACIHPPAFQVLRSGYRSRTSTRSPVSEVRITRRSNACCAKGRTCSHSRSRSPVKPRRSSGSTSWKLRPW